MGKNLNQQRRGKGSSVWRSPSHRYLKAISFGRYEEKEGVVVDLVRDALRSAPLAIVRFVNGEEVVIPAADGMYVGQIIKAGENAPLTAGNIVPVSAVPEGGKIYCVEMVPGDGGKLVRTAGSYATVVSKEGKYVVIKLPSGKIKRVPAHSRAVIGSIAGAGIKEKPIIKAGKMFHIMRAKHRYWPRVAATSMNAVEHPFGGGRKHRHAGKPQTVSRNAPPGKKSGYIAASRTGRKKR